MGIHVDSQMKRWIDRVYQDNTLSPFVKNQERMHSLHLQNGVLYIYTYMGWIKCNSWQPLQAISDIIPQIFVRIIAGRYASIYALLEDLWLQKTIVLSKHVSNYLTLIMLNSFQENIFLVFQGYIYPAQHGCWWPGDTRGPGVSSTDINLVCLEHFSFNTRRLRWIKKTLGFLYGNKM